MSLQRSSSAPHTVASLVPTTSKARQAVPRSKSHLHVHKPEQPMYLKPLVTGAALMASSASSEREDPFNLLGFFPTGLTRTKENWQWLRGEETEALEEDGDDEDANGPLLSEEAYNEAIAQEDKLGILKLSLGEGFRRPTEERLLSPYALGEGAEEWEALYEGHCVRRRTAEGRGGEVGPKETGFGVLFFPGSS